jgi:hypothetical protein
MMAHSMDLLYCLKMVGGLEALRSKQVGGDRCNKIRRWRKDCSV